MPAPGFLSLSAALFRLSERGLESSGIVEGAATSLTSDKTVSPADSATKSSCVSNYLSVPQITQLTFLWQVLGLVLLLFFLFIALSVGDRQLSDRIRIDLELLNFDKSRLVPIGAPARIWPSDGGRRHYAELVRWLLFQRLKR
jgi:hypothetical protein